MGRNQLPLHVKGDISIFRPVVKNLLHKVLERVPGHEGFVFLEEVLDRFVQGAIEATFSIKGAFFAPRPVLQAESHNLQVATEASVIQRGGIELIADVQVEALDPNKISTPAKKKVKAWPRKKGKSRKKKGKKKGKGNLSNEMFPSRQQMNKSWVFSEAKVDGLTRSSFKTPLIPLDSDQKVLKSSSSSPLSSRASLSAPS